MNDDELPLLKDHESPRQRSVRYEHERPELALEACWRVPMTCGLMLPMKHYPSGS